MSSVLLETRLEPDPRLRRLLLLSALLFLIAGFVLIVHLPFAPVWRALIVILWFADGCREMVKMTTGMARVVLLKLDASGRILAADSEGEFQELTLLTGSMVLRRFAWLRLRFPDNSNYAELFSGDQAKDEHWQRFQLIWQQSGGAFGKADKG